MENTPEHEFVAIRANGQQFTGRLEKVLGFSLSFVLEPGRLLEFCLSVPRKSHPLLPHNVRFILLRTFYDVNDSDSKRLLIFVPSVEIKPSAHEQIALYLLKHGLSVQQRPARSEDVLLNITATHK